MLTQTFRGEILDCYTMDGPTSKLAYIQHDKELGKVSVGMYVNLGATIVSSKSFKSLAGAKRCATKWVNS